MYNLKGEINDNFIFGMQINIEVFYKLMLSFWVFVTRHAQSTQNNLHVPQYLQKSIGDKVHFLPADKQKLSPGT